LCGFGNCPADALLSRGLGAAPLALLTDDAESRLPELIKRFAERVASVAPSEADGNLLLSCGYILMGLRYDKTTTQTLFAGVQKMKESSTYQAILEEGRDEGRDEGLLRGRREALLDALQERFQTVPPEIEAKIRAMTDMAKLQTAFRRVFHINAPNELPLD
jgi:hypothetical protein